MTELPRHVGEVEEITMVPREDWSSLSQKCGKCISLKLSCLKYYILLGVGLLGVISLVLNSEYSQDVRTLFHALTRGVNDTETAIKTAQSALNLMEKIQNNLNQTKNITVH